MSVIKFEDIRVGDTIQATRRWEESGDFTRKQGVVTSVTDVDVQTECFVFPRWDSAWEFELIERPKPEFKPGQVWQYGDTRYLVIDNCGESAQFVNLTHYWRSGTTRADRAAMTYIGQAEITVKP